MAGAGPPSVLIAASLMGLSLQLCVASRWLSGWAVGSGPSRQLGRYLPAASILERVAGRVVGPFDEPGREAPQALHEQADLALAAEGGGREPLGQVVEARHLLLVKPARLGDGQKQRARAGSGDDQDDV